MRNASNAPTPPPQSSLVNSCSFFIHPSRTAFLDSFTVSSTLAATLSPGVGCGRSGLGTYRTFVFSASTWDSVSTRAESLPMTLLDSSSSSFKAWTAKGESAEKGDEGRVEERSEWGWPEATPQ